MKQPKRLTRRQKEIISKRGYEDIKDWRLVSNKANYFLIINLKTKEMRTIYT